MGVVTFHAGEQEGSPVDVKVLRVELNPVRRGLHAKAWAYHGLMLLVERDEGIQGVLDMPAPLVERAYPELVRNVFLPFRGNFKGAVDFDVIQEERRPGRTCARRGSP